jgi:hypothetical protein
MSTMILKINRGDSVEFSVTIPEKSDPGLYYTLTDRDVLYFALLYPNQLFEEALILQGYTLEDQDKKTKAITIRLSPNETRLLEPGVYYYSAKLQRGGTIEALNGTDEPDEVRTIIERTKFIVNN